MIRLAAITLIFLLCGDAVAQQEVRYIEEDWLQARVEVAIRHRAPWSPEELEIRGWRLPAEFEVPVTHRRMRVHFSERDDFIGRVNASVEFVDANDPDSRSIRRTVSAELIVERPVVVTAAKIRRGVPLNIDAVRTEIRDLRSLPTGFVSDPSMVLGQTLARTLPEGTALLRTHLQTEPVIKRGEMVRIEAAGGGLDVVIEARALDKGAAGERIRFENPNTRRRFVAEVTGPGTARLARPGVGAR